MGNASLVEQILEKHSFIIFSSIVVRIHDGEGLARQFFEVGHAEDERGGDGAGDAEFGGGGGLSMERGDRRKTRGEGGKEE